MLDVYPDFLIRDIEPRDYAEVVDMWNEDIGNKNVTLENIGATVANMSARGGYRTLVAAYGERVVGMVTTVNVLAVGCEMGYVKLSGLAVRPDCRRRGIATRLIERVKELAKSEGYACIGLATGVNRLDAHKFYEKLGFSSDSVLYGLDLS